METNNISKIFVNVKKSKNDKVYMSFKITFNDNQEPIKSFLNYDSATKLFKSSDETVQLLFNPSSKEVILGTQIFETKKTAYGYLVSFEPNDDEAQDILNSLYNEIVDKCENKEEEEPDF